jgi:hypothetical protein
VPRGVNYPVFIPESCRGAIRLIEAGQTSEAINLITGRAIAGDGSAAALLAFLHMRKAVAEPNPFVASKSLLAAAKARNAYAEFVVGMFMRGKHREKSALYWLKRSANQAFPPAIAYLGLFMTKGWGFPAPARKQAWRTYKVAFRMGYVPTGIFVADLFRTSKNVGVRIVGRIVWFCAILYWRAALSRDPFNERVFYDIEGNMPLFTVK